MNPIRALLAAATVALAASINSIAQPINYETGVHVVTVAGRPSVPGNRDGVGDEALFGTIGGIATIGESAYVASRHTDDFGRSSTTIQRITGRTVATVTSRNSGPPHVLVGDPERHSMLLSQFQVTPGARGEFERLTATGDVIGTLTFQAGATIYKGKAVVMQGTSPVRLSILDLEFGNTTYLAGGFIGGRQDGVGEFAGIDYAGTIATASEHAFFPITD